MNNTKELKYKSFDEFYSNYKKNIYRENFDYDELTESQLKSKAILGEVDDYITPIKANDLIRVFDVTLNNDRNERCWSRLAGDLNERETYLLINHLDTWINNEYEYHQEKFRKFFEVTNEHSALFLSFVLKNSIASDHYMEILLQCSDVISKENLLHALKDVKDIEDTHIPLLEKVFGKEFTKAYINNKKLVDRTPRKWIFLGLTEESIQANFLDAFTRKLKEKTSLFGEDPLDYRCLSNALKKDGFRDVARELMQEMLTNKEQYFSLTLNQNNNNFIRKNFPELIKLMEENLSSYELDDLFKQISRRNFKNHRIMQELRADESLTYSNSLINDLLEANPDNSEQAKKVIQKFYELNERPYSYNSSYNTLYPRVLLPFIKLELPDWMYVEVNEAIANDVISIDRLGNREALFDAAKTWKFNSRIWKKEAEIIGKMPLKVRMVAGAIFNRIAPENTRGNVPKTYKDAFWKEMKKAQDMGWDKAILHYCEDNAETRGRVMSIYHPNLDEHLQRAFRSCIYFKYLIDIDITQQLSLIKNIEERLQIKVLQKEIDDESELNDAYVYIDKPVLKRVFAINKIFKNKELKEKYLQKISNRNDLLWIPVGLSDEKCDSFVKFLEKNLFYDDGLGNEVIRSYSQLDAISKIWNKLTPEQEQFSYEKLLGLSYTQESINYINEVFEQFKNGCININTDTEYKIVRNSDFFDFPDDLRLYQKLLIGKIRPRTQEEFNEILLLKRTDGLERIANLCEINNHNESREALVDLIIGNDAQINDFERKKIAELDPHQILRFKSKNYKEIVDKIIEQIAADPNADDVFRKYYAEMENDTNVINQDILQVREHYQQNREWITPSAIRVMTCFGRDYEQYFNKISKYNLSIKKHIYKGTPDVSELNLINIHDALYWLPLNIEPSDKQSFKEFVDKWMFYKDPNGVMQHRNFSTFEGIAKAWSTLSKEDRKKDYDDIVDIIKLKKYKDCRYVEFGIEATKNLVGESEYKNLEKIYEQGLQVPELIDSSKMFCKTCNVKSMSNNPSATNKTRVLIGRFLPRDDPRVGFFGKHTNCCQHFWGAGKACAISSIRDPFSQLFVVEKKDGTIVAGSWVWESKIEKDGKYYKALCFDNIEALGDYKNDQLVIDTYKETLPFLASLNYAKVTVGMGYQDGKVDDLPDTTLIPMNKNYSGYTDAGNKQKLLLDNPNATPVDYNDGDIYVTGALEKDIPDMQHISNICFPQGDQRLQLPENAPQGLVLRDKGKIIGYVIYSEEEHSIYDMAVLPEYRSNKMNMPDGSIKKIEYKGGSRSSSLILLEAMAKKIKEIGAKEEWSAELRDSTSFKYMKFMAARGLIDLKVGEVDHTMSDGSKVISVKFSIKDRREPSNQRQQALSNPNEGR